MTNRWLTRALLALAAPALLIPVAGQAAAAAPAAPAVPTIDAVAKIYPHLEGGSADITRVRKVRMPERSCKRGPVVHGASGQEAFYGPDVQSMADLEITGKKPIVTVTAQTFPSAKVASQYLRAALTEGEDCASDDDLGSVQMKKIRFKLGDERWGAEVRLGTKSAGQVVNGLFIRSGKAVLAVVSMSMEGKTAPSVPKTLALARLALKTLG